jgi:hypothetical protein
LVPDNVRVRSRTELGGDLAAPQNILPLSQQLQVINDGDHFTTLYELLLNVQKCFQSDKVAAHR